MTGSRLGYCARDRLMSTKVWLFAIAVPLLVRLPLPTLARWLRPKRKMSLADPERIQGMVQCVDNILRQASYLIRRSCLTRGIILYFFLCRAGLDIDLHFGVGEVKGTFEGHCWLEKDGEPFLEATDPRLYFSSVYCVRSQTSA
jgi:hypothetical protein